MGDGDRSQKFYNRRIRETSEFQSEVKALLKKYPEFSRPYSEMRRNLQGYAHDNPNSLYGFHFSDTLPRWGMPSFRFYYKYDDDEVTLYTVEEVEDEDEV